MKDSPLESLVTAVVFVALSLAAWQWQHSIRHRQPSTAAVERWEHVRELFPAPEPLGDPSATDPELLQRAVRANPFSRQRRHIPKPAAEGSEHAEPEKPPPAQFVFKGRVVMGTKQRGILEDRQQKKTYFVQTGQDVQGFKVMEIAEDQMVLSNLQTNEEVRIPLASKATESQQPSENR